MPTKIEWCTESWNPIAGCSHISPGCDHCYAERMANRLASMNSVNCWASTVAGNYKYFDTINSEGKWNGTTYLHLPDLEKPLKWKKPRMIFVVSMGDLFHESVPFEWIDRVFDVMTKADQHIYLLLTKRPERMREFFESYLERLNRHNVWLGITAENQEMADKRIPVLLQIPAAKRFVSIEPMLSEVKLKQNYIDYLEGWETIPDQKGEMMQSQTERLDWVIVGGETGPGARPMHSEWVRLIKDQCREVNVPFFFKQMTGRLPIPEDLKIREYPKR